MPEYRRPRTNRDWRQVGRLHDGKAPKPRWMAPWASTTDGHVSYDVKDLQRAWRQKRRGRTFLFLSIVSVIAYPVILGATDHLVPSGNLGIDIAKYGLEFGLGSLTTVAIASRKNAYAKSNEIRRNAAQVKRPPLNLT